MSPQHKQLWEKITRQVRESGLDNMRARELYDELSKLLSMDDKVIISLTETENGIEVRINEAAYGNLALVGLLEKVKLTIMENDPDEKQAVVIPKKGGPRYDA